MEKKEKVIFCLFILGVICSLISMLWTAFDLDNSGIRILIPVLLWVIPMFLTVYCFYRNNNVHVQAIIIPFIAMFLFLTVRCDLKGVVVYNFENKSFTTKPFITFINPFLEKQVIVRDLDFERIEGDGRGLYAGREDDYIIINYKANIIFSRLELMTFVKNEIKKGPRPYVLGICFIHDNLQDIITAYASENKIFIQPHLLEKKLSHDLEDRLFQKGIKTDVRVKVISISRNTYIR